MSVPRKKTLNGMGSQALYKTELTDNFLLFCKEGPKKVIEIGAAYGFKSQLIVETGANLLAIDIDPEHITSLQSEYPNIKAISGDFCNIPLEKCSYDGILIESVLHFMDGEKIRKLLKKCNSLLVEGGEIFIMMSSPFLKHIDGYYRDRITEEFPGFIPNPGDIHSDLARLHSPYHVMDEKVLSRELVNTGFTIKKMKYLQTPHMEYDMEIDGREGIMAIGTKLRLS